MIHKDSTVVPAVLGLARVLEAAGDLEGADKALASLAHEAEVVFARAWLLEERDPETALQLYARLETLALGHSEPYLRQALLLAESDPVEAREKLDVWWEMEGGVPHEDAVLAVALGLKADGELEGALELLDSRKQAWPDGEEPEALAGLRDRIGVEREALRLAAGGMVPLTSVQAAALARARKVFNRGGNERALEALRELLGEAPRNAELWATIGDVHRSRGAVEEAERAYVAATTLAPEEARYHANLGTLLAERYGGRRHREAIAELGAALAQKSSWAEIHFRLANVQCEAGRFEDAAESLRAYLTLEPGGAHATEASELLEDLERTRPVTAVLPASPELDSDVPDPARLVYRVARVYRGRGEKERARVEAMKALELAPSYLDALMLLAAMDLEDGDQVSAAQRYRRCFELAPHDPGLLLTLGDLERAAGQVEAAQRYFRGAAEAGAPEAFYRLADMAAERGDLREARRLIDSYFEVSTGGLAHEPALALQARVQRQLRLVRWGVGGGLALVFALAGAWLLRRRTGSSLQVLLARKPASYHEVARLLSAIRHEVLKHNTNLLASVALAFGADDVVGETVPIDISDQIDIDPEAVVDSRSPEDVPIVNVGRCLGGVAPDRSGGAFAVVVIPCHDLPEVLNFLECRGRRRGRRGVLPEGGRRGITPVHIVGTRVANGLPFEWKGGGNAGLSLKRGQIQRSRIRSWVDNDICPSPVLAPLERDNHRVPPGHARIRGIDRYRLPEFMEPVRSDPLVTVHLVGLGVEPNLFTLANRTRVVCVG